jgi:hypothetical protein
MHLINLELCKSAVSNWFVGSPACERWAPQQQAEKTGELLAVANCGLGAFLWD